LCAHPTNRPCILGSSVQSLFQVIIKYAQTLHTQVKCLRSLQFVCTKYVFCLLWVSPGQVAIHVGAKGLPLLPGERALLTIIPVQAQVRLGRVAAQLFKLILPMTLSWQCIQYAYNMHTLCRFCEYIVFALCRLNADFVFVHIEPFSTHNLKLSPLTPSQCPG
jgi:hypothetical protein